MGGRQDGVVVVDGVGRRQDGHPVLARRRLEEESDDGLAPEGVAPGGDDGEGVLNQKELVEPKDEIKDNQIKLL